ncbi:MAG: hypothetical protein GF311_10580 [Candidatus Lokiarchaeota archaeon]|nr:hypothetical protein [Candidatus Lokiarchaeota archaeon]
MSSYTEIIKEDHFDKENTWRTDTEVSKLCWGCEKPNLSGYMAWDMNKARMIFLCEDCFKKLVK